MASNSLQVVKLRDELSREIAEYLKVVELVAASKFVDVPHLTRLCFATPFQPPKNESLLLRRACDNAKIALELSEFG